MEDSSDSVEDLEKQFIIAQHEANVMQFKVKRAKAMREVKNLDDLIQKHEETIKRLRNEPSKGE